MDKSGIQPYEKNRFYWQYHGTPILLIGGSDDDNLFQWAGDEARLLKHLDTLVACGGNYVRNTMSSRAHAFPESDEGMAYPYKKLSNGKYDLNQWDDEFWRRLSYFLRETQVRGIVVQLEVFDMWGLTGGMWPMSPWNPDNNINYTYDDVSLSPRGGIAKTLFACIPELNDDRILMDVLYQYVDRMLDITLQFEHVLYQINNESYFPYEIGDYWASLVHRKGAAMDKTVFVCDSRNFRRPSFDAAEFRAKDHPEIRYPLDHADLYNYTDISQNGGNCGQTHYDNLIWYRSLLLEDPKPINHVKTYQFIWPTGSDFRARLDGSPVVGARRFWRNIFGGAAASRHHRPMRGDPRTPSGGGLGLSEYGQTQLRSMRMLIGSMNIFAMEPRNDLLRDCEADEAYALVEEGQQYAVYFTGEGDQEVTLDTSAADGSLRRRWLNIERSSWGEETVEVASRSHVLRSPGDGQWAVLLSSENHDQE